MALIDHILKEYNGKISDQGERRDDESVKGQDGMSDVSWPRVFPKLEENLEDDQVQAALIERIKAFSGKSKATIVVKKCYKSKQNFLIAIHSDSDSSPLKNLKDFKDSSKFLIIESTQDFLLSNLSDKICHQAMIDRLISSLSQISKNA